jgi:hypothetical protein
MINTLYDQRLERIKKAVALDVPDKIPLAPCANAYWAASQNVELARYISDFELACTTNLKAISELGADATQNEIFSPYLLPGQWLSKVAVPGKQLSSNSLWQVLETENMKREDYGAILREGFGAFYEKFLIERCENSEESLAPFYAYAPIAKKRFVDAGIPCVCDFLMISPFEIFCGGRSLEEFFIDLMEVPELVNEAFGLCMAYQVEKYENMLQQIKPFGVWIGGWRSAPSMIAMPMWEKFVWPYIRQFTDLCIKHGTTPIFHLDSNWDRGIDYFNELPAKKCILALDSSTDIRNAKKSVGQRMCITGDVPAQMLAFGSAADVRKYQTDLIHDIGPEGYIASSVCDIPYNAKPENVRAFCDATNEYLEKFGK